MLVPELKRLVYTRESLAAIKRHYNGDIDMEGNVLVFIAALVFIAHEISSGTEVYNIFKCIQC